MDDYLIELLKSYSTILFSVAVAIGIIVNVFKTIWTAIGDETKSHVMRWLKTDAIDTSNVKLVAVLSRAAEFIGNTGRSRDGR